jgi:hypothetical protein
MDRATPEWSAGLMHGAFSSGGERGQAALESALVLPLLVFLVLGIIQLTLLQQGKVMTEYAAFSAARAGIVWNGNNERMRDAAVVSLLPTMGRTDDLAHLAATWERSRLLDLFFRQLPWGTPIPAAIERAPLRGLVRVDTVSPAQFSGADAIWNLRDGSAWKELEFDGAYTYPEDPRLDAHFDTFLNTKLPDRPQDLYRKANVLTVRIRYWYELRIPFANRIIFLAWYAWNAHRPLRGAIDRPTLDRSANMANRTTDLEGLESLGQGLRSPSGFPTLYQSEMKVLWSLATGHRFPAARPRYFIPLTAAYSMRMQSNFHRKWLMH